MRASLHGTNVRRAGARQGHKSYSGIADLVEFFVSLAVNFEPATRWKDTHMELRRPIETIAMPDQFPVFEVILKKRGRAWRWCVRTTEGQVVMQGSERRRHAAKYRADRALFLLLLWAPYRGLERRFIAGDKIR